MGRNFKYLYHYVFFSKFHNFVKFGKELKYFESYDKSSLGIIKNEFKGFLNYYVFFSKFHNFVKFRIELNYFEYCNKLLLGIMEKIHF